MPLLLPPDSTPPPNPQPTGTAPGGGTPGIPYPNYPTQGYCTDEDICVRAASDFPELVPRDMKMAAGSDGSFAVTDLWTLNSGTINFAGQGVQPGMICQLLGPKPNYVPPGELFAVNGVGTMSATLRRRGMGQGVGQPPSPAIGLAGVPFAIYTLQPEILRASYELNRQYGVDDLVVGRRTSDQYDPTELLQATVLTVLVWRYAAAARAAGGGDASDTLWAKYRAYKKELDDLIARVVVFWKGPTSTVFDSTNKFTTRISR